MAEFELPSHHIAAHGGLQSGSVCYIFHWYSATMPDSHPIDDYVTGTLMRDLVGHDRRPASFLIYLWFTAEQQRRDAPVRISYQELAENIGVSKSAAQSSVAWLLRRKLLTVSKATVTATPTYTVLTPWTPKLQRKG
jgi:hypothetical protein